MPIVVVVMAANLTCGGMGEVARFSGFSMAGDVVVAAFLGGLTW